MSIIRAISPLKPSSSIDQSSLLAVLRDRIFQYVILSFTLLAFFVAIAVTYFSAANKQPISIIIAWCLVFVIAAVAFFRILSYRIRVFAFAAILFIAAAYLLLSGGFSTHGLLLMMGFVIIVTLFNGIGDGIVSGIIALGAIYITGSLITSGLFSLPSVFSSANPGFDWLIGGVSFFALASISIGAISITLATFQNTINIQTHKITTLSSDKNDLSSTIQNQKDELTHHNLHIDLQTQVNHLSLQTDPAHYLLAITNLIEKSFSLYHVGIYLLDESKENLILQAATGETGQILAEQKFKLKVGKNSIVGFVATNNEPRYAPNVTEDTSYYQNPMLPYTRSELSLPIRLNERIIGVLDLQADHENAFPSLDIRAFQLLGAQIGSLISTRDQASRLEKLQLENIQTSKANIRKSWKNHLQSTHRNYNFHLKEQKLETDSKPDQHAQTATEIESYVKETITLENGSKQTVLALPIKLRGQVIGVLDLHYTGTTIPEDLIQLLNITSDRLALALENARLLEELEMRAEREHLVGDISARVRSSTAVQDILSTAASELGRSLGVSEVIVQLRSEEQLTVEQL